MSIFGPLVALWITTHSSDVTGSCGGVNISLFTGEEWSCSLSSAHMGEKPSVERMTEHAYACVLGSPDMLINACTHKSLCTVASLCSE